MSNLNGFFCDDDITEVLINNSTEFWIERRGQLQVEPGIWQSENEYKQFIRAILDQLNADLSLHEPFCSGRIQDYRVQIVGPPVTANPVVTIRRIRSQVVSLKKWTDSPNVLEIVRAQINQKKNILIYGATGSGKTTLLSSLLSEVGSAERVAILEDIEELILPNTASLRLNTRSDPSGVLRDVTLSDLVKHSLRLRPDRIALGEVRGAEAKDLLMALATGHKGSFGTLHAYSFNEALLRLEMLIQLGAPQWQTRSIRQLILLSIDCIIGVRKKETGERLIVDMHKLTGLEDFGFLSERLI